MRLVQLRWDANPKLISNPVWLDPDRVQTVIQCDDGITVIGLQNGGPLLVCMPAAIVVEQLYEGYGATKH